MDNLIYFFARIVVAVLRALPLLWVARLGRAIGALAFRLDGRHRRVALDNLTMCFRDEKSPEEIHAIAKENFRRIGENFTSAVKTSAMSPWDILPYFDLTFAKSILPHAVGCRPAKPDRGARPFWQLRIVCPVRPVRARLQMRHHLSGLETTGA
ncbi:MAG: hypothetical protein WDN00_10560 [Limisphaerales bacterium]